MNKIAKELIKLAEKISDQSLSYEEELFDKLCFKQLSPEERNMALNHFMKNNDDLYELLLIDNLFPQERKMILNKAIQNTNFDRDNFFHMIKYNYYKNENEKTLMLNQLLKDPNCIIYILDIISENILEKDEELKLLYEIIMKKDKNDIIQKLEYIDNKEKIYDLLINLIKNN